MERQWAATDGTHAIVRASDRWNVAAIISALVAAAAMSLLPLITESSETIDSSGAVVVESTRRTLTEGEGPGVVAVTLVPALIASIPMLGRTQRFRRNARLGASVALGIAVLLGAASIGLFVVPTLILMILAVSRTVVPSAGGR